MKSLRSAAMASVLLAAGCSSSDSSDSVTGPDDIPPEATTTVGDIVIRNHGLDAFVSFVNVVASDDFNPDFEANLLLQPVAPGTSQTISSELCGESVDWRTSSGTDFVFSRSNESFPCGGELDILVNPDPFVAPETALGTLVVFNNATEEGNLVLDVELRRSGLADAVFGPGRLADDEVLLSGDEGDFDASPCDIGYDIRLLGVGGVIINVLENTFIQCESDTEIVLTDDDF